MRAATSERQEEVRGRSSTGVHVDEDARGDDSPTRGEEALELRLTVAARQSRHV